MAIAIVYDSLGSIRLKIASINYLLASRRIDVNFIFCTTFRMDYYVD